MKNTTQKNQRNTILPAPVTFKIDGVTKEYSVTLPSSLYPLPERLHEKFSRVYTLIGQHKLSKTEKKELKTLLNEDRVSLLYISQVVMEPKNWVGFSYTPGYKILLTSAPDTVVTSTLQYLEVSLLIDEPVEGTFDMAYRLSKNGLLPDSVLMTVVGHSLLPEHLSEYFQKKYEAYVFALTV